MRESGGEEAVADLDRIRDQLSRAWLVRVIIFLLAVALLLAIGFLGGRNWWSRLAWASVVLSISAAIATIAYTVILDAVVPGLVTSWREEALRDANPGPTLALVVDKGLCHCPTRSGLIPGRQGKKLQRRFSDCWRNCLFGIAGAAQTEPALKPCLIPLTGAPMALASGAGAPSSECTPVLEGNAPRWEGRRGGW